MNKKTQYTEYFANYKYGNLMTVENFIKGCLSGLMFEDLDGYGHPVKDEMVDSTIIIQPSKVDEIPKSATHIVWFNR